MNVDIIAFLEKIADIHGISISLNDKKGWCSFPVEEMAFCVLEKNTAQRERIAAAADREDRLFAFVEEKNVLFYVIRNDRYLLVIGPADTGMMSDVRGAYLHRHHMERALFPTMKMTELSKLAALVCLVVTGENVGYRDIKIVTSNREVSEWCADSEEEDYLIEKSDYERSHDSAAYEGKLLDLVREGNVEGMKHMLTNSFEEKNIGVVSEDDFKQTEYLVVTMIALLSRTAVEGGMSIEEAYSMADIYLRKLSRVRSSEDALVIGSKAQLEYTEKVAEVKRKRSNNPYVEECKNYIAKNLRKPFKVGDISQEIGINRSYLTTKFTENEGMTIQQYITEERCRHAANLLRYSKYPISIIAEYFCFSSQSHFGRQFKKQFGMTPKEYRNKYQKLN